MSAATIEDKIFRRWSIRDSELFAEALNEAIISSENKLDNSSPKHDPLTSFTFVASLSLAGTAGCIAPACRAGRAQVLSRYAALYADKVIAPMQLLDPHRSGRRNPTEEFDFRRTIAGTVLSIHEMRPAIEAGMIDIVTPQLHFCQDCGDAALRKMHRIEKAADRLAKANLNRFSLTYEGPAPRPFFTIRGPVEYCEHGGFGRMFNRFPTWLSKSHRAQVGIPLPDSVVRKSRIVDHLFRMIGAEVSLQEFLGFRYDAKTLTTNPGELSLLSELDPAKGTYRNFTTSLSRITHSIPLMGDITLSKAIRIRKQEGDAFLVYRTALTEVMKEVMKADEVLDESKASQIVGDILRPQVDRLRQLARSERKRATTKAGYRLAFAGAILSLGLFRGLLPAEYSALGSATALAGLVDSLAELRADPTTVRNQNFYYLLRLTQ